MYSYFFKLPLTFLLKHNLVRLILRPDFLNATEAVTFEDALVLFLNYPILMCCDFMWPGCSLHFGFRMGFGGP